MIRMTLWSYTMRIYFIPALGCVRVPGGARG
jgi:hypothetical protein